MSGPLQDRLRHVELKVIDNQHCADMYGMKYNIQVDRDMHLCAGPILSGGKGTCIVSIRLFSGPENIKKSRPIINKLVKSNKSISRIIFFDQIPFFAIPKMAKKQFLNWENGQKCNFTKKKNF